MRSREFLSEASIFTKPDRYGPGHKVNVAAGSSKGKALLATIKQIIPDFDTSEELEWIATAPRGTQTVSFGAGGDVKYFRRPNGEAFGVAGAEKSIQTGLVHAKGQKGSTAENKGDLSEPVLSAAVVAKLIKRGGNNIEDITDEDVKDVLNKALASNGQTFTVNDKNSKIADKITFSIALRAPTLEYLKTPGFWESYGKLLPSATHYANSGQIDRYADYFYKNGKVDTVIIRSDGMSQQKERKTDIDAFVTDENGNTRPLKNLNISLKAGSPHIGQVGGGQIKNPLGKNGVWTNAERLFGPFGVRVSQPDSVESKVEFWNGAYKEAAAQIKAMLAGQDARSEAGVIYKITKMVTEHGTSGDPNIKLVSLGTSGVSSIHSFKGLEQKLKSQNINLDCDFRQGTSKTGDPRPEIRVFDKNTGQPLIYIRYSSTQDETKVWNTIEMRELLKKLTTLNYGRPSGSEVPQEPETPATPPKPGPTTTTMKGTAMQAPTSAGIANQNRTLGNKIPMGSPPSVNMPQ
jgi:hypothetical protein